MSFIDYKMICAFHSMTPQLLRAQTVSGEHREHAAPELTELVSHQQCWGGGVLTYSKPGMRPVLSRTVHHLEPPQERSLENLQEETLSPGTKLNSPPPLSAPPPPSPRAVS